MVGRAARRRVDEVPFVDRDDRYGTGARLQSVFDGPVLDQAVDHTDTKLLVITEDSRSEVTNACANRPSPITVVANCQRPAVRSTVSRRGDSAARVGCQASANLPGASLTTKVAVVRVVAAARTTAGNVSVRKS
jgi:hypothetical protein